MYLCRTLPPPHFASRFLREDNKHANVPSGKASAVKVETGRASVGLIHKQMLVVDTTLTTQKKQLHHKSSNVVRGVLFVRWKEPLFFLPQRRGKEFIALMSVIFSSDCILC
jgi:hypothetical protein